MAASEAKTVRTAIARTAIMVKRHDGFDIIIITIVIIATTVTTMIMATKSTIATMATTAITATIVATSTSAYNGSNSHKQW